MVPNLDDLEDMEAPANDYATKPAAPSNNPLSFESEIPSLDVGSRGSRPRFAQRASNNNSSGGY